MALWIDIAGKDVLCIDEYSPSDPDPSRVVWIEDPLSPVFMAYFMSCDPLPMGMRLALLKGLFSVDDNDSRCKGIASPASPASWNDIQEFERIETQPVLVKLDAVSSL